MTVKCRTGYSFRAAAGKIDKVLDRLQELGHTDAPITDRASTFGWYRWKKACEARGMSPTFGVELAVTSSINAKRPSADYWTFLAQDSVEPINALVTLATTQFRYQPLLTLDQALAATNVFKMTGSRPPNELWDNHSPCDDVAVGLMPSTPIAVAKLAQANGWQFAASSDNRYPAADNKGFYEILTGRNAETQTYPQHLLSADEWAASVAHHGLAEPVLSVALARSALWLGQSRAKLLKSSLPKFKADHTLLELCQIGALNLGCDISRPEYVARLERELALIKEKGYEDYFYIVADICNWARSRMLVGPARGSSCGSLVCYLLGITTVDPIPFGLIFERFVDINRSDMPDIDIDFSDQQRSQVFKYIEQTYGRERVARLGTVAMFQPRSALAEVGMGLSIPKWMCDAVAESMIERSSGDSRALNTLEDTLMTMPAGKRLLEEYPECSVVAQFEGHPRHYSQHAAGVVISAEPIVKFVAVDHRTGATMCDKKDAEDGYNLLKIDCLGLTQLSVFEDALELAGLPHNHLESLPLDDPKVFEVLNDAKWSGIFQFNGQALQSITKQFHVDKFDDIVSVTALVRPGPLASGGAHEWIRRRNGTNPVTYPHPVFEPYLMDTLGIVLYQEQVMEIGRKVGDLSWEQVTLLRKAMSKSLGKEYFDQFGDPWKAGAIAKGVPADKLEKVWDDLCAYGAWCLSGSTKLRNPHPNQWSSERFFTIEQLYNSGGLAPGKRQSGGRKQKIFCWDGSGLKPATPSQIIASGEKETFRVTTASGNSIRSTAKHRFMISDGSFKMLEELNVGDRVVVRGERQATPRKQKTGTGSGRHNWRKSEIEKKPFLNGKRGNRKKIIEASPICTECQQWPSEEVHHISGDHQDHSLTNLQAVCRKCHKKLHREQFGQEPKAWTKGWGTEASEIVSIGDPKFEQTYDICMPSPNHNFLAEDFVVHNSFNKSHSVAYGLLSYWCCWLKAYFPFEFAAATLSHEENPQRQIQLLREMKAEGYDYIPVDPDLSGRKWAVGHKDNKRYLVGPLHNVRGIGPKMVSQILSARNRGEPLSDRAWKLLANPKTDIDSLWPVRDGFAKLLPDPLAKNIVTHPTPIIEAQPCANDQEFLFFCTLSKINPRDENEVVIVARRGGKVIDDGRTTSLNLQLTDDTDTIFGKITRFDYERIGRPIVDLGRIGKALYAVKGRMRANAGFRMVTITNVRYIGDLDKGVAPETRAQGHQDIGDNAGVAA